MMPQISHEHLPLILAFGSTVCFASASVIFTHFSRRVTPLWMNTFKALVCGFFLLIFISALGYWQIPPLKALLAFLLSGAIGLGVADLFLLAAFTRMGAARTLMVFGFQPVFIGIASYFLFNQDLSPLRLIAIVFFIICLFLLSLEKFKEHGHWEIKGLLLALCGVILDNSAVLTTRWGFESADAINPFMVSFYRVLGALGVFLIISFFKPVQLISGFQNLTNKEKYLVLVGSFFGTFVSISLYLFGLRLGHLASMAAIGLSGPLISALIECVVERKSPSKYLAAGIICMGIGMTIFFGLV